MKTTNKLSNNNQKSNEQSQIAAPSDFQAFFPREIIHMILHHSSSMLRLRIVSPLFREIIDDFKYHEEKTLFQRNIQYYLVNFLKSSKDQSIEPESVFTVKTAYALTHNLMHQITFLDIQAIKNFISILEDSEYLDPLLEAITFCDDVDTWNALDNDTSDDQTSEESLGDDFTDIVPDFLQALWDNKEKLPNLKKLSFGTLRCTVELPPFDIETLIIKEIIGNKNDLREPFCPSLKLALKFSKLKTFFCDLYNACFTDNGQPFQDDGKDWDNYFPELETLTFGNINYAAIDAEGDNVKISTTLVLNHQKLKHLGFKGVIETTVDLKDLPNLQCFYLNEIGTEGLLRLSASTLTNGSILAGLKEFSNRENPKKLENKTQNAIQGEITSEIKYSQKKTLSTIQAIEEFIALLKTSDFADDSIDSIALCDYVNPTLDEMESANGEAFDDVYTFDSHFDNQTANAYKNAVCSLLATLETDMHKLSNLKAVALGNIWFDINIPACFDKLETLIFKDLIGCSNKDYFPSIIFSEALKNLKTLLLGNLNNAFLKNGKKCFQVADWGKIFPSLTSLSVHYLMSDQWSFKHEHLEHLSFNGKVMSDITLYDLPNLTTFYLQELDRYSYLGLSGLALSNDVILTGLFEYAKKKKQ